MNYRSIVVALMCFSPICTLAYVEPHQLANNPALHGSKVPALLFKGKVLPATEFNGYMIKRQYSNDTVIEDDPESNPESVPAATSTPVHTLSTSPPTDSASTEPAESGSEEDQPPANPELPEEAATSSYIVSSSSTNDFVQTPAQTTGTYPEQTHNATPAAPENDSYSFVPTSSVVQESLTMASSVVQESLTMTSSLVSDGTDVAQTSSAGTSSADGSSLSSDSATIDASVSGSSSESAQVPASSTSVQFTDTKMPEAQLSETTAVIDTTQEHALITTGFYTNSTVSLEELTTTTTTTLYVTTTLSVEAQVSVEISSETTSPLEKPTSVETVTETICTEKSCVEATPTSSTEESSVGPTETVRTEENSVEPTETVCTEEKCIEPERSAPAEHDFTTITLTTATQIFTTVCSGSTSTYTSTIVYTTSVCLSETEVPSKQTDAVPEPSVSIHTGSQPTLSHVAHSESSLATTPTVVTSASTTPVPTSLSTVRKESSASSLQSALSPVREIPTPLAYENGANIAKFPVFMSSVIVFLLCSF